MDKIIVNRLNVASIIGVDSWERSKAQPLILTVTVYSNIRSTGQSDALDASISYADVAKRVKLHTESSTFRSMEALSYSIIKFCFDLYDLTDKVTVDLEKPKGLLHAKCPGVVISRTRETISHFSKPNVIPIDGEDVIYIRDLSLHAVVGVNPWEREDRQIVIVNLDIFTHLSNQALVDDHISKHLNYRIIARAITHLVEKSSFLTIEALITSISQLLIRDLFIPRIKLSVEKPSALLFADSAKIEIMRSIDDFPSVRNIPEIFTDHTVFIAFGTNLGNRQKYIHDALDECDANGIKIIDTSFLYESKPMYVTDQPLFLNGVFKALTQLSPNKLLIILKQIEEKLGRDFSAIRNGPRVIDLDILFYDDLELNSETLTIPHISIQERSFVLTPLSDIAPNFEHPTLFRTCATLNALLKHKENSCQLYRVTPLLDYLCKWDRPQTIIMGILNVTPDSFSDGGRYVSDEIALQKVMDMVSDGANIIDIGGQSTRPGAEDVTIEEEITRVVPIIQIIRASLNDSISNIPISIDTFRIEVAKEAINAGASFINDVTGGDFGGDEMMKLWKSSRLPVCVMHMRGTPKTMTGLTQYKDNNVIKEVRDVLGAKVSKMIAMGIRRWNIIIDPGVGFAKDAEQNFQMIKNLPLLVESGGLCSRLPLLVGVSRKGFIGKAVGDSNPKGESRKWGTAGACSAAINSGCNILRVHDVKEMRDVILVADKCFRN